MGGIPDILRPGGFRIVLAATFVIPLLFLILAATGLSLFEPVLPAALAVVSAYLAACLVDRVVQSRAMKIAIASAAALASIFLGNLLVRSMTMICDPVHEPGIVCDPVHVPDTTATPTVIPTVQPTGTTPMIFDPVHEPGGCSGGACTLAPGIPAGIVAEKLDECLKKL